MAEDASQVGMQAAGCLPKQLQTTIGLLQKLQATQLQATQLQATQLEAIIICKADGMKGSMMKRFIREGAKERIKTKKAEELLDERERWKGLIKDLEQL